MLMGNVVEFLYASLDFVHVEKGEEDTFDDKENTAKEPFCCSYGVFEILFFAYSSSSKVIVEAIYILMVFRIQTIN